MSLSRARQNLDQFVVGAQVDRAEPLALLAQVLEPALDFDAARQRLVGFMIGKRGEARRLTIQFARDRVPKLFVPRARAFQALFGGRALLARGAHRFERLSRGAIGVGERGFAQRKRVGGLLARGFRFAMFVGERAAGAGEIGRRVGEAGLFPLRFRPALGEFGDPALRPVAPLIPGRPLGRDRRAAGGARRSLAGDRLRRGARLGEGGPLARRQGARAFEALRDVIARPELIKRGLGVGLALRGFVARRAGA